MNRQILLSPLLRASLPRAVRRDLTSRWFPRLKTTNAASKPPRNDVPYLKTKQTDVVPPRSVTQSSTAHAQNAIRRGIGGTGSPQHVRTAPCRRMVLNRLSRNAGAHLGLPCWSNQTTLSRGRADRSPLPDSHFGSARRASLCRRPISVMASDIPSVSPVSLLQGWI